MGEKQPLFGQAHLTTVWLLVCAQLHAPTKHVFGKSLALLQHSPLSSCPPVEVHSAARSCASVASETSGTPSTAASATFCPPEPPFPVVPPVPAEPPFPVTPPFPVEPPFPVIPPFPVEPPFPVTPPPLPAVPPVAFAGPVPVPPPALVPAPPLPPCPSAPTEVVESQDTSPATSGKARQIVRSLWVKERSNKVMLVSLSWIMARAFLRQNPGDG